MIRKTTWHDSSSCSCLESASSSGGLAHRRRQPVQDAEDDGIWLDDCYVDELEELESYLEFHRALDELYGFTPRDFSGLPMEQVETGIWLSQFLLERTGP